MLVNLHTAVIGQREGIPLEALGVENCEIEIEIYAVTE